MVYWISHSFMLECFTPYSFLIELFIWTQNLSILLVCVPSLAQNFSAWLTTLWSSPRFLVAAGYDWWLSVFTILAGKISLLIDEAKDCMFQLASPNKKKFLASVRSTPQKTHNVSLVSSSVRVKLRIMPYSDKTLSSTSTITPSPSRMISLCII